jgi:hypothetical protein
VQAGACQAVANAMGSDAVFHNEGGVNTLTVCVSAASALALDYSAAIRLGQPELGTCSAIANALRRYGAERDSAKLVEACAEAVVALAVKAPGWGHSVPNEAVIRSARTQEALADAMKAHNHDGNVIKLCTRALAVCT